MPDTLVIIFFVAILTSLATWVVPVGMFDSQEVQYQVCLLYTSDAADEL